MWTGLLNKELRRRPAVALSAGESDTPHKLQVWCEGVRSSAQAAEALALLFSCPLARAHQEFVPSGGQDTCPAGKR